MSKKYEDKESKDNKLTNKDNNTNKLKQQAKQVARGAINISASVASAMSSFCPPLLGIPLIASVYNEVCGYFDAKSVEQRLTKLESRLEDLNIKCEEFEERINKLEEHEQYVFRNNVKYLCLTVLPEVTDTFIDSIIVYVMESDNRQMNEEVCEILADCDSHDLKLVELLKECKRYKDSESNYSDQYHTVLWNDFLECAGYSTEIKASDIMTGAVGLNGNTNDLDIAYLTRSLLKMQRLGVIEINFYNTVGTISEYNIKDFNITVFGENLIKCVRIEELQILDVN